MKHYYLVKPQDMPVNPGEAEHNPPWYTDDAYEAAVLAHAALGEWHGLHLAEYDGPDLHVVVLIDDDVEAPEAWDPLPGITDPRGQISTDHAKKLACMGVVPSDMTYHVAQKLATYNRRFRVR